MASPRAGTAVALALALSAAGWGFTLATDSDAGADRESHVLVSRTTTDGEVRHCATPRTVRSTATGGCVLRATAPAAQFTVMTVFGDNHLARCRTTFTLHVGARGRLLVDEIDAVGKSSQESGTCGDIRQCPHERTAAEPWRGHMPWTGRLVAGRDGGHLAELDACFATCYGELAGTLRLRLMPGSGASRIAAAQRAPVGRSGFEVSGTWRLRPAGHARVLISTSATARPAGDSPAGTMTGSIH